jgi:hypothetical protein
MGFPLPKYFEKMSENVEENFPIKIHRKYLE